MKIKLTLSYDGTAYCGYQVQDGQITIQQVLEEAIKKATGESVKTTASGRTDSGVHAKGQIVSFDTNCTIPPEKLYRAINVHLPNEIRAIKSEQVEEGFDARRSAKKKTYLYRTYTAEVENPLVDRYAVKVDKKVKVKDLKRVAKLFVGTHDFKCFCASGSSVKTTVRTIYGIKIVKNGEFVDFFVTGNGFLYNMVRTLVGTVFALSNKDEIERKEIVEKLLKTGDRTLVGKTFPAKGLTLYNVEYK